MSQPLPCDGTGRRILAAVEDVEAPGLGLTDGTISGWLSVDRSLVGHWRSGARSMPAWGLARVLRRVGPAAAAAGLRVLAPAGVDVVVSAIGSPVGLVRGVVHLSRIAGELAEVTVEAMADGRIDERERREISAQLDAVDAESRKLRAALAGGR